MFLTKDLQGYNSIYDETHKEENKLARLLKFLWHVIGILPTPMHATYVSVEVPKIFHVTFPRRFPVISIQDTSFFLCTTD